MQARARVVALKPSMLSDSVVRKWNAASNWFASVLPRRQRQGPVFNHARSVSSGREPYRMFGRLLRNLRSMFIGSGAVDRAPARVGLLRPARGLRLLRSARPPRPPAVITPAADTVPAPSASELINEGLRQRQQIGIEAARPFFEKAAQLEPNSHVPWFMLGNVASEMGDLDTAVAHYAHARDLHPTDHVIRYNLGLNQLWRGYIDAAIEELRVACGLNPTYLQAQSSHIMALHNSDRVRPEEIDMAIREWAARFSLEHPACRRHPSCIAARATRNNCAWDSSPAIFEHTPWLIFSSPS